MVLNDTSPQGGSYAGQSTSTNNPSRPPVSSDARLPDLAGIRIKPELMTRPDPFTLYTGFYGKRMWRGTIVAKVADRMHGTWVLTGRRATQVEVDAFTESCSRSAYYGRTGIPLFTSVGVLWMYRSAVKKNPNLTATQRLRNMSILLQHEKAVFWSIASRAAFKMLFIGSLGGIISSFASSWVDMSSILGDPRLQQWREDSKAQKDEDIRKRKLAFATTRIQELKHATMALLKSMDNANGDAMGSYDDTPTQQQQYTYDSSNDTQSQSTDDSSQSAYQSSGSGSSRAPQPSSQSESGSDFFLTGSNQDDDASPTAPEHRNTKLDGTPISAWDRIRAQNGAQNPVRQSPMGWEQGQSESTDSAPTGAQDKYDYDRRREKDMAQSEFDRMMDNERKGADGESRRGWGS
ncbi:uncharacterized protein N7483_010682 [Penicillium malachiteum]|uniref:uncharacterized protein n=1 Tax=Penicillium malachiteum TaxID=1324776 RepID=UPI0025465C1D|nr:uncharacterized protein N7483_010682 [Penicillium malachiteum]KAJ5713501.1 hypothetical protein N7483_010682 [Penicillium malachiteum]